MILADPAMDLADRVADNVPRYRQLSVADTTFSSYRAMSATSEESWQMVGDSPSTPPPTLKRMAGVPRQHKLSPAEGTYAALSLPVTCTMLPMLRRCRSLAPMVPVDMTAEEIERAEAALRAAPNAAEEAIPQALLLPVVATMPPMLARTMSLPPSGPVDQPVDSMANAEYRASPAGTSSSLEAPPAPKAATNAHVLLLSVTYACDGARQGLEGARFEVEALASAARGGAHTAHVQEEPTIAELRAALGGVDTWWYAGPEHGGLPVFATDAGHAARARGAPLNASGPALLCAPSLDEIVALVGEACTGGPLRTVVLNACNTLPLAEAIFSRTSVQTVICWETLVEDTAARIFGCALASAVANGSPPEMAFEAARAAVTSQVEPGSQGGGRAKYALYDPAVAINGRVPPRFPGSAPGPVAAGMPQLLQRQPLSEGALASHARKGDPVRPASPGAGSASSASTSALSAALTRLGVPDSSEYVIVDDDEALVYRSLGCLAQE